jgi:hypothetical protein
LPEPHMTEWHPLPLSPLREDGHRLLARVDGEGGQAHERARNVGSLQRAGAVQHAAQQQTGRLLDVNKGAGRHECTPFGA